VNIGIAGSQTQHVLWQLENGAIDGINPRVVVLMIGVNHLLASPSHQTADIARGISSVVAKLREKLPQTKIILLGTFPKDRISDSPDRLKIQQLNSLMAALDDGCGVRFFDLTSKFLGADGSLSPDVSPDGVHLSPMGYQIWADALTPIIREMTALRAAREVAPAVPLRSSP
jgi:lysophospholipase L1-like esterase